MASAPLEASLEIRKLPLSKKNAIQDILEVQESWKKLMKNIPYRLQKDTFICDINKNNPAKYKSEHFRLIEEGSILYHRKCSNILLDEWGTSGRIRPALGHLLYLLEKAQLFRAADYVAELLGKEAPKRPTSGPAAVVTITEPNSIEQEASQHLDNINYPSQAIQEIIKNSNKTAESAKVQAVPKIVIEEYPDINPDSLSSLNIPLVIENIINPPEASTSQNNEEIRPNLTELLNNESNISETFSTESSNETETQSEIEPSVDLESSVLPKFSELHIESNSNSNSSNLPAFDVLQSASLNLNNSNSDQYFLNLSNTTNSDKSKPCSPLPSLSLNTLLPHYAYSDIESATNSFNLDPFTSENDNGRFLGSGAFGSVFIAFGLKEKPVAVKKLLIDVVDEANIKLVTKQFRNEVEVLYKYKHDNLLSLLGFSCDGCTYCLVYEYIAGGSLKDNLQKEDDVLTWTQRLDIASGVAGAVAYLHTGFSSPLIHRDIKSANILLDTDNRPKLCDFGLIKLTPNLNANTSTMIIGTSPYMAPEAFRSDISVKLDTFSFGAVLLELLTSISDTVEVGHLVNFVKEEETVEGIDMKAGSWEANSTNFAGELSKLALRCLEDNKKIRPYMTEVADSLQELIRKL